MIRIETSIQVGKPRDEVFEFLSDVGNIATWQKAVVESRPLSKGVIRTGFQFEERVEMGSKHFRTTCTLTDFKPSERLSFNAVSTGPFDFTANFNLQPIAGGTRMTITCDARPKGFWKRLQPVLPGALRKESQGEIEALKRVLEAEPAVLHR